MRKYSHAILHSECFEISYLCFEGLNGVVTLTVKV